MELIQKANKLYTDGTFETHMFESEYGVYFTDSEDMKSVANWLRLEPLETNKDYVYYKVVGKKMVEITELEYFKEFLDYVQNCE